jgi:hypothetical protein
VPHFQDIFDTWEDAVAFQKEKLDLCRSEGEAIRACSIDVEKDHRTGKMRYIAYMLIRFPHTNGEDH